MPIQRKILIAFWGIIVIVAINSCSNAPKHKSRIYSNDTTEAMRLLIDTISKSEFMFYNNPYDDRVIVLCDNDTLLRYLPGKAICLSRQQICNMAFERGAGKNNIVDLPEVLQINEFTKEDSVRYKAVFTIVCLIQYRLENDGTIKLDSFDCLSNSMCGYKGSMKFVLNEDNLKASFSVDAFF